MVTYIVREGDSIFSIAENFGVSESQLTSYNGLANQPGLVPGQAIIILSPDITATVQPGDSLDSIAAAYGTDLNSILRNNPGLSRGETLYPGQTVVISYEGEKLGNLSVNGYAYTYIDRKLLSSVLPFLTYLTIFTYGFQTDGTLVVPEGDEELIGIARSYGVAPVMLLSTLTEDGVFSNQLSSAIFNDAAARENLIQNVLSVIREKNYYGLDIDFEYILPSEAQAYVDFITQFREQLAAENIPLWVSLAPKTSSGQPGILYESHNYAALGAAADFSTIMTYEWGYKYGPPMAVAPLNKVREVVSYAVTQIEPARIFMGIPNYGNDWTLPYVKGESDAPSIGVEEALSIAYNNGATVQFDETAGSPFFRYFLNGREHEVWFEDARSIEAKLGLIRDYGLRGCAWWNVMRPFTQNLSTMNALYNIEHVEL